MYINIFLILPSTCCILPSTKKNQTTPNWKSFTLNNFQLRMPLCKNLPRKFSVSPLLGHFLDNQYTTYQTVHSTTQNFLWTDSYTFWGEALLSTHSLSHESIRFFIWPENQSFYEFVCPSLVVAALFHRLSLYFSVRYCIDLSSVFLICQLIRSWGRWKSWPSELVVQASSLHVRS